MGRGGQLTLPLRNASGMHGFGLDEGCCAGHEHFIRQNRQRHGAAAALAARCYLGPMSLNYKPTTAQPIRACSGLEVK